MPAPLPVDLENRLVSLLRERLLDARTPLDATTDLYQAGLDSMGIMQLLILIEQEFGVIIPDEALTRANFGRISELAALIRQHAE